MELTCVVNTLTSECRSLPSPLHAASYPAGGPCRRTSELERVWCFKIGQVWDTRHLRVSLPCCQRHSPSEDILQQACPRPARCQQATMVCSTRTMSAQPRPSRDGFYSGQGSRRSLKDRQPTAGLAAMQGHMLSLRP
jgi:hypothetical protein